MEPRATIRIALNALALLPALCGQHLVQGAGNGNGLAELKAALDRPGPEGAEGRQAAIETLLGMLDLKAHALLQEKLRAAKVDDVQREIVAALSRHARNAGDKVFSIADENKEQRQQVVRSYVPALVTFWLEPAGEPKVQQERDQLREQVRGCASRLPMGEVKEGLQALMTLPTQEEAMQIAALNAAADWRDLYLATFLAEQLGHSSPRIQAAARAALRRLTFGVEDFTSNDQFQQWRSKNAEKRYSDLAEEAARSAEARMQRLETDYRARFVQANVDLVAAMADNRTAVDWAAVQARVLADEPPGTTDACLDRLRLRLQDELHTDKNAAVAERQAFHKALLEAFARTPPDNVRRRALLLETTAFLLRPGEGELAAEMEKLLIQQLATADPALVQAAVRALRRFPTAQSRAALVHAARVSLDDARGPDLALVRAILRTLGRPGNPAWTAPAEADVDKADWLALIRRVFAGEQYKDLRSEAMAMAVVPDARGERLAEVFDALLNLAKDQTQTAEMRQRSLIHLKDFLKKEDRADTLVRELAGLLADPDQEIRLFAATELAGLRLDHSEQRRKEWIQVVQQAARERLRVETNANVLRQLVACITAGGRPPGSPDLAIGSIKWVLEQVGFPVPAEQQFRVKPLLAALTEIVAEPMKDPGSWLSVCDVLARHNDQRRQLRQVLESQNAVRLAADIVADANKAERARQAMHFILSAALLKPASEPWTAPELKQEAADVRSAFAALESVKADLDLPGYRMLRLQVLGACGAHQEVVALGTMYLQDDRSKGGTAMSPEQKDAVRLQMAEAQLSLGKPDKAEALLKERDPARAGEPAALLVADRLAKALIDGGAADKALPWLDRALQATGESDPRFRARLVQWAQTRMQLEPAAKQDVVSQLEARRELFKSADCAPELREAFERLRGQGR
jgi:hypothetical protein